MIQVAVVPNLIEDGEGLDQAICLVVLDDGLVEGADVSDEYDGSDVVEALDPFLALVSLSAHVEDVEVDAMRAEFGLEDAVGADTGA